MTRQTSPTPRAVLFIVAASALALTGCEQEKKKMQPPPAKIVVAHPASRMLTEYGEYTGHLDAIQRIEIRPQVRGRLIKVHVPEGTEIKKGTLLYEIDPNEYLIARDQAQAALEQAQADINRTNAEYRRALATFERIKTIKRAISEDEYIQAVAAEATAKAAQAQAQAAYDKAKTALASAKLNLSYTKIFAPIDGRVSRTLVTEGNLIGYNPQETHLTIMVDVDPIYVYFDVPERDIIEYEGRVKSMRPLIQAIASTAMGVVAEPLWSDSLIPIEASVTTETGYPHKGVINFRDPRFEPGTGTLRLRGLLDNSDRRLSSGMYAHVRFPRGLPHQRLVVPAEAVMSGQQGRYVYVIEPRDPATDPDAPKTPAPEGYQLGIVLSPRTVTVGPEVDQQIPIEKGKLKTSDLIVVQGVQKSRPGSYVFYKLPEQSPGQPK